MRDGRLPFGMKIPIVRLSVAAAVRTGAALRNDAAVMRIRQRPGFRMWVNPAVAVRAARVRKYRHHLSEQLDGITRLGRLLRSGERRYNRRKEGGYSQSGAAVGN